jgi:uncharacterized protein RhaS with RHS repeats
MVTSDSRSQGGAQVGSRRSGRREGEEYSGNERTNTYEVSVSGSSKTFTFDANGNMTGDGTRTFEWDAENRLIAIAGLPQERVHVRWKSRRVRMVERVERCCSERQASALVQNGDL